MVIWKTNYNKACNSLYGFSEKHVFKDVIYSEYKEKTAFNIIKQK